MQNNKININPGSEYQICGERVPKQRNDKETDGDVIS